MYSQYFYGISMLSPRYLDGFREQEWHAYIIVIYIRLHT